MDLTKNDRYYLSVKGWKRPFQQNNQKPAGGTVLTFDKMDLKPKLVRKDKGNHTLIKGMVTEYRYAVTLSNLWPLRGLACFSSPLLYWLFLCWENYIPWASQLEVPTPWLVNPLKAFCSLYVYRCVCECRWCTCI